MTQDEDTARLGERTSEVDDMALMPVEITYNNVDECLEPLKVPEADIFRRDS